MKKSILLLLFITGFAQAQIINFPDANFKAKLLSANTSNTIAYGGGVSIKIDANSDGEIQILEAQAVDSLEVISSTIGDLNGVSNFSNLKKLNCGGNQLTSLDVTSLGSLIYLGCIDNLLTSLDINGLSNLVTLLCHNNQLSSITLAGLNNLETLYIMNNQFSSLDVSTLSNLKYLFCDNNQLTSSSLLWNNNLQVLSCSNNQLTSLIPSNNLILLECSLNQLTSLNLSGLSNLESLRCSGNQLTTLDFSGLLNLQSVYCSVNQLTSLDFSQNPVFKELDCSDNNLVSINIKNGIDQISTDMVGDGWSFWGNNPNLSFVCVDDTEVIWVQGNLMYNSLTTVNVNTYCSFTPGGDYNTITGSILFDVDNNGCDASDVPQPFIKLNMDDGTNDGYAFNDTNGNYTFYTLDGTFTVTPDIENPSFFNFSPVDTTVNFPVVDNSVTTQNFCMTANGIHPDAEIVIAPIGRARPGFDAIYQIVYKNKGNQLLSSDVNFTYNDGVVDFVSATVSPDSQSTGSLNWNYSNLRPFENRTIYVTLHVNSPTDTPAVNSGDILDFTVTVNPISGDELPADNVFEFHQTVVNSQDPNEKQCVEGNIVSSSEIGNYLHYIIHFENIGTAEAENVVVKDIIDTTMFDVKTLQIMNSSHPVEAKVTGNVVEFIFKGIKLPAGGHGNILLKIKTKSDLEVGDVVSNKAEIFFDYNYPIDTNVASTAFQSLGTNDYTIDQSVSIYPNPSKGNVLVKANGNIKSVQLFDIQGRVLETRTTNEQEMNMDISKYSNGVYFLKVLTDVGIKTEKLIKN